MKTLTACILLLASFGFSPVSSVPWSSERLSWDQYSKKAGPGQVYKAFTYCGIRFTIGENRGFSQIEVEAFFDPSESWVHPDHMTPALLNHEQGHFDLAEIFARRIRKAAAGYQGMPMSDFISGGAVARIKTEYVQLNNELFRQQQQYDVQTRHGQDVVVQAEWDAKIAGWLAE